MIIAGMYSFKRGREVMEADYPSELDEIRAIIASINTEEHHTKVSAEKTMNGRLLYSHVALNRACKAGFLAGGWREERVMCDYPTDFYAEGYQPSTPLRGAFREMDFVKNRVGVEVQLGEYAFMVYNVCAKMTIFHNLDIIDAGVEIVPIKDLAVQMSSGVSYFEQIVWDLQQRGEADIDIPVLILGVAPQPAPEPD